MDGHERRWLPELARASPARRLPPTNPTQRHRCRLLPARDAPPMHYGSANELEAPTRTEESTEKREECGSRSAMRPDTMLSSPVPLDVTDGIRQKAAPDPPLLRPWYTSRNNSYTVAGAAMGQADRDILKLGASTKSNFSHFGDTKSVAGGAAKSVKSSAAASGITLSYTSYADVEDGDAGDETVSNTKARKADLLFHFDEEAQYVLELIYEDKDKTFGFEDKKKKKKKGGIVKFIKNAVDDLLLPPAMRPQWEKEQAAMKKEKEEEDRMKKLKAERDWKRAGGLKEDDDEDKTAAARLLDMKKALGEGTGERMTFDPVPIHGYREQGRFGCVPQRNVDYIRKTKFQYDGGRFGGQRDGLGTQAYNDDYVYEGDWILNQRQGFGSLDYPDGSLYEGQFFEGKQHGLGVLRTKDGKTYKGEWKLAKKHGFGEMPDKKKGLIFSGQWAAGKRHGFGIQLDLKSGQIYAGQWEFGLKHGEGVVKQRHESMGTVRTRLEWNKGKLIRQEPYDALIHGTEVGEAAMWASHYSKECAMDADLAVAQMIQYPEHPLRPKKEIDYQVQEAQKEAERLAAEDGAEKEGVASEKEEDRMKVPAVEFRRLISLVHSSDSVVEQLVLPILDDAVALEETETEAACMMVGHIWDENLLKLSHHFATKIQRQWRRTGLRRMVKIAREEAAEGVETDEQRRERLLKEVHDSRIAADTQIVKQREIENAPFRALQKACDLAVVEEDNRKPNELLLKTRQLFRLEAVVVPSHETRWKMMINDRIARRLEKLRTKGSLWKAAQPKMKNMIGMISAMSAKKIESFGDMDFAKSKAKVVKEQEIEDFLADLEDQDLDLNMVKYTDGTRYYGEVYDGLPQGYGVTMNPDGSVYSGQMKTGLRDGLGVYVIPMSDGGEASELDREYAGEWLKGRRHGFAIERILFKKHFCKSCVISEYEHDARSMFTKADPADQQEWMDACEVVVAQARGAKIEAEAIVEAENVDHSLKATQQVQYDWRSGMSNYTGHYNEQGQKHGLGVQSWHDGQEFAGTFFNDVPHGGGREAYPNRSWYIGSFKNGLRHGWGKYQAVNGIIYLGQFQNGVRHGYGIEREESKDIMLWMAFVQYENNQMVLLESVSPVKAKRWLDEAETSVRLSSREASEASPPARIEYPSKNDENALVYIGGTLDGQRAGLGVLTHNNGSRYIGEFQQDKKSGLGIETYQDGSVYKGHFNNGRRNGWGEYTDAKTGRMYRGNWVNGQRHGHGWERAVLKMISGNIFKEFLIEYENDKEKSRRFITKLSRLDFLNEVLKTVKRAEEVQELTVEIYEEMLD